MFFMLPILMIGSSIVFHIIIKEKGENMKSKLMWIIYFIASFGAFHSGLALFNFNLLTLPLIANIPFLPQIVLALFGICGLISLVSLFTGCCECK